MPKAGAVFTKHDDAEFRQDFAALVKTAYADLFGLHGDEAWTLPNDKLISYFRSSDHTSSIVGRRQAGTFQTLAGLSGHGEAPVARPTGTRRTEKRTPPVAPRQPAPEPLDTSKTPPPPAKNARDVGLTVRIEINLPAAADQDTYDRIFKSIRENLLGAE